jgi:nicotinic acid phosphoribosyltransferase
MQDTINQFLKFHTDIFLDCYKMWNSDKYAVVQKGSFYSQIAEKQTVTLKTLFPFLEKFKFDVDVIQKLGAAQNDEKKMLYDESFLNMLQRLDIEKSLKFAKSDVRVTRDATFIAKGSTLHLMIIEVLLKGIWSDVSLQIEI